MELVKGYNRLRSQKFVELVKNSHKGILLMNRFKGNVSLDLDDETKKFSKGAVHSSLSMKKAAILKLK